MGITIDADTHFWPRDAFEDDEGPRRFGSRWPRFMMDALGRDWVQFSERTSTFTPQQWAMPNGLTPAKHHAGYYDAVARAEWLDEAGFDMQVLVPNPTPLSYSLESEIGVAVCRAYNDAVARALRRCPGRFIGLASIPMQDPVAAIEELDRSIGELGLHAPVIYTHVNGHNLDEHQFWPVYKRIEELGVPLTIHGNRFEGLMGLERLRHMHLDNPLGFLYEATLAVTSLIMEGVMDTYPRLRVGLLETAAGWLPYLMDRLQEVYEGEIYGGISPFAPKAVKDLILKPPEAYMDRFWLCFNVEAERRTIPSVVERFGADRFMINSDFPHNIGGGGKGAIQRTLDLERLESSEKEQLLGLSACALFGIDPVTREQVRGSAVAVA